MQCQIKFISHMEISFLCMSFVLIRDREVCECVSVGQCETPPMAWKEFGKDIWYPKLKQFTHKHVMPWWLYLNVKWQINITYLMLCNSYIITIRETYRLGPCNSVVLAHSQNKSEHKQLPILTHSLPIRVTVTEALYNIKICAHMFMCVDEGNSGAPQC